MGEKFLDMINVNRRILLTFIQEVRILCHLSTDNAIMQQ